MPPRQHLEDFWETDKTGRELLRKTGARDKKKGEESEVKMETQSRGRLRGGGGGVPSERTASCLLLILIIGKTLLYLLLLKTCCC